MNNDFSKKLLKVLLIVVITCAGLSLIRALNIKGLYDILAISLIPISALDAILFLYVMDKGEKLYSKIGLIVIAVDIALYIFSVAGLYHSVCTYDACNFFDHMMRAFDTLCSSALSVCNYMAIFSLLKTDNEKIKTLEKVAFIAGIVYAFIMFFIELTNLYYKLSAVVTVGSMAGTVANTAFIVVIILYLMDKTTISDLTFLTSGGSLNTPNIAQEPVKVETPTPEVKAVEQQPVEQVQEPVVQTVPQPSVEKTVEPAPVAQTPQPVEPTPEPSVTQSAPAAQPQVPQQESVQQ